MARCLVTGGAGFLGSGLARRLARNGFEIAVFDRAAGGPLIPFEKGTRRILGDIGSLTVEETARLVEGFDTVFHFAYSSTPRTSLANPQREEDSNIRPSLKIIDACLRAGVGKFVFPSSGSVYGRWLGRPFRESDLPCPDNPYALSKKAIEDFLVSAGSRGLGYTILRPGSAFGPGQNPLSGQGAVTYFLHQCLMGQPIQIHGRGEVRRDFTFSDDIISCSLACLGRIEPPLANVSTQVGTTLLDIVQMCFRLTSRQVPLEFVEALPADQENIILDNSLLKESFGFVPTALEEGMEKTLRWLIDAGLTRNGFPG